MNEYESIRRLLAEYCQRCDDERFDEWAELFIEDGAFIVFGQTHRGRAALAKFIASAPVGKHLCFNSIIDISGSAARCASDFVFIKPDRSLSSIGRYSDLLVKQGERWLFAERSVAFFGKS